MIKSVKFSKNKTTTADWRLTPGYLHEGRLNFESAHILFCISGKIADFAIADQCPGNIHLCRPPTG